MSSFNDEMDAINEQTRDLEELTFLIALRDRLGLTDPTLDSRINRLTEMTANLDNYRSIDLYDYEDVEIL